MAKGDDSGTGTVTKHYFEIKILKRNKLSTGCN